MPVVIVQPSGDSEKFTYINEEFPILSGSINIPLLETDYSQCIITGELSVTTSTAWQWGSILPNYASPASAISTSITWVSNSVVGSAYYNGLGVSHNVFALPAQNLAGNCRMVFRIDINDFNDGTRHLIKVKGIGTFVNGGVYQPVYTDAYMEYNDANPIVSLRISPQATFTLTSKNKITVQWKGKT